VDCILKGIAMENTTTFSQIQENSSLHSIVDNDPVIGEIHALHEVVTNSFRMTIESAIRIGELLISVKDRLPHGKFLPWVKANLTFQERTGRNYMRLFRERDKLKTASVADLTAGYRLLSSGATGPAEQDPTAVVYEDRGGHRVMKIGPEVKDPELSAMLVPPFGKSFTGLNGDHIYLIEPSKLYGYYFVTTIDMREGVAAVANGSIKPLSASALGLALEAMGAERLDIVWVTDSCEPLALNKWLQGDQNAPVDAVVAEGGIGGAE
jgi:Protein of unknown function (DUF3102)